MIQERIKKFSELSFEKQKSKLIDIISKLEDSEWFFQKILKIIKTSNQLKSENLISIYQNIIEFWEKIKNINKKEKEKLMKNLHQKIINIQEKEKNERKNENPDDLLNNLLNNI